MANFKLRYTLLLKGGTMIEQESNDYYVSDWLAERVLNGYEPIYREDIVYIKREELADGGSINVYSNSSQPELFKQIIEDTEKELDDILHNYRQRADLF